MQEQVMPQTEANAEVRDITAKLEELMATKRLEMRLQLQEKLRRTEEELQQVENEIQAYQAQRGKAYVTDYLKSTVSSLVSSRDNAPRG